MLATVTLASTSFASAVGAFDTQVNLASTSGIVPGVRLFANREMLCVERLTGIGNNAVVRRGLDGTGSSAHATNETVYIGSPEQFYDIDPQGVPVTGSPVNPYINTRTGVIWVIQGDDVGSGAAARAWQPVTTTQTTGALGVRVTTTTTPS